jgi:hypothetical protein
MRILLLNVFVITFSVPLMELRNRLIEFIKSTLELKSSFPQLREISLFYLHAKAPHLHLLTKF